MLIETLRGLALFGAINTTDVDQNALLEPVPIVRTSASLRLANTSELQLALPNCTNDDRFILCPDFRINRSTPNSKNLLDIVPYVRNWRSFDQWKAALLHGWGNGLDYLGQRGCDIRSISDNFFTATRRVVVGSVRCVFPENP